MRSLQGCQISNNKTHFLFLTRQILDPLQNKNPIKILIRFLKLGKIITDNL